MSTNPHTLIDLHPMNQSDTNFDAVQKAHIKGVYIKATEGTDFIANGYIHMASRARGQGLRVGFYHFLRPRTDRSGFAEANHFFQAVRGFHRGDGAYASLLRLVVDVETREDGMSDQQVIHYTEEFVARFRHIAQMEPMLYTFPSFIADWSTKPSLSQLPLWIAHYGVRRPKIPSPWMNWTMWQYTDKGTVSGVHSVVDKNKCPRLAPLTLTRHEY